MPSQVAETSKRPGYSTANHILNVFPCIVAGKLRAGDKVTNSLLEELNIPEAYEVRIGLRHLGFVDRNDCVTETFVKLAHAPGHTQQTLLDETLHDAYADVFHQGIDPSYATQLELRNAFRDAGYLPVSMRGKMVSMFRGLCRAAGIIVDEVEEPQESSEQPTDAAPKKTRKAQAIDVLEGYTDVQEPLSASRNGHIPTPDHSKVGELLDSLALLRQLSKSSTWPEIPPEWWYEAVTNYAQMIVKEDQERKGRNT